MRLYHSIYAPNARRVRWFLAEKGLEIPLVAVDLAKQEHRAAPYQSINPFELIPSLELDDGVILSESIAICRYFEELHPNPPLLGTNPLERAQVEMWQRLAEMQLLFPIAQTYRHTHPAAAALEAPQVPAWAESSRAKAMKSLARFDEVLASRPYLAGDSFTVADITAAIALDFTKPARITIPDELTHLKRWREQVSARPAAKA